MSAARTFRLAFYGDDFTGSTDALEVLAFAGLRAALFLRAPNEEILARFPGLDAFGVAGDSRDMSVAEMDKELPAVFEALARIGAEIVHYKTCSTFDSGPTIGSIGRVAELSRNAYPTRFVPIVGATPALHRYCLFGNLFARSGTDGQIYRIDRHPIMSVHPVTPISEGDLALHLARQTEMPIAKLSYLSLRDGIEPARRHLGEVVESGAPIVLFDSASADHLTVVGGLIADEARRQAPLFVIGGSGVEYALTQWWRSDDQATAARIGETKPTDQVIAISGSASKLTATQIRTAVDAGFDEVALDARALLDPDAGQAVLARIIDDASRKISAGRSVLMHTAQDGDDPRIGELLAWAASEAADPEAARTSVRRQLGLRLGEIAKAVLERTGVARLVISGGDTSSQVIQVIAPDALEVAARLAPGVPLCRMRSRNQSLEGVEVALKGGQMGDPEFFVKALRGTG